MPPFWLLKMATDRTFLSELATESPANDGYRSRAQLNSWVVSLLVVVPCCDVRYPLVFWLGNPHFPLGIRMNSMAFAPEAAGSFERF